MRIGIDLWPLQERPTAERGIGRFTRGLIRAIQRASPDSDLMFYAVSGMPIYEIPRAGPAQLMAIEADRNGTGSSNALDRYFFEDGNPDGLDVLLCPHPLRSILSGNRTNFCRIAVWYDCVPEMYREEHLPSRQAQDHYDHVVRTLSSYDAVLTLSDSARYDLVNRHGFDPGRVLVIGSGIEDAFQPDCHPEDSDVLSKLGISGRFVLNVGGLDPRKGIRRLIRAFAVLPDWVLSDLQLVLAFDVDPCQVQELLEFAGEYELRQPKVICTGWISDEMLATLYRHAAVMVYPSTYEGFGLPIAEAMACGCPTACGHNSSQIEVAGDAALLIDVLNVSQIADSIQAVVECEALSSTMRRMGLSQAAKHSWTNTVGRVTTIMSKLSAAHTRRRATA